jgi:hypothetical protein
MKTKIIFQLRAKISGGTTHEFLYNAYFIHDNKYYFLNSCVWNGYGATSKEAKAQIMASAEFVNIIDHLLEGEVIKHNGFESATILNEYEAIMHKIYKP